MVEQRDWVDYIDILVVPFVVLLLGLLWPTIGRFWRRRRFSWLVLRELAEVSPAPTPRGVHGDWRDYSTRRMLHRQFLREPEVVLSINPSLAYHLGQLWNAFKEADDREWHYHLRELRHLLGRTLPWRRGLLTDLDKARWRWALLHEGYGLGEAGAREELADISKATRQRATRSTFKRQNDGG